MSLKTPVRPILNHVEPYRPGKPIGELRREKGLAKIVKLASNENPLGPSPMAQGAILKSVRELHRYPEGTAPALREALAAKYGLTPENYLLASGSDEILHMLCESFLEPKDSVVGSQNGFIRFRQSAHLMGSEVRLVPEKAYHHDLDAMLKAVDKSTKIVYIASPNNPTGTYTTRAQLRGLLKALPETVLVVVDEAYHAFASHYDDYPQTLPEMLRDHGNLIVLRTFSKSHGLAGLRVGFAAMAAEIAGWLHRVRLPFNVNLPAQMAAEAALADDAFVRRSVDLVRREMDRVRPALLDLGFQADVSGANFLFAKSPVPAEELFEALLDKGVIVRPLGEYGLHDHVRISLGKPEENEVLLAALREIRAEKAW